MSARLRTILRVLVFIFIDLMVVPVDNPFFLPTVQVYMCFASQASDRLFIKRN
jgi:hypothetical protein